MSFTVKIEPRTVTGFREGEFTASDHTVYDIRVIDGEGSGAEEYLLGSHQGYENRAFARRLAIRLFGSPSVIAREVGVSPVGLRQQEPVELLVYGANGDLVQNMDLR